MLAQAGFHLATLALQGHVQAEAQLAVPNKWLLQELQQALPQPQARPTPQTAPLTAQRQTVEGQPCLVVSGERSHMEQHHDGTSGSQALLVCRVLRAQAWLSELPSLWLKFVVSCSGRQYYRHSACMLVCQAALCWISQARLPDMGALC